MQDIWPVGRRVGAPRTDPHRVPLEIRPPPTKKMRLGSCTSYAHRGLRTVPRRRTPDDHYYPIKLRRGGTGQGNTII